MVLVLQERSRYIREWLGGSAVALLLEERGTLSPHGLKSEISFDV